MTTKAMVILSGGQDSTTCLYWAKQKFDEVHAITFDYGQKHRREIECAVEIARLAKVASHDIIRVEGILGGRSPLTNPAEKLETYASAEEMEGIIGDRVELTFVPFRNLMFLVVAANHALTRDITDLVTGVCQADNANYPDCRASFIEATGYTLDKAVGLDKQWPTPGITIHTPLMDLSKAQSIHLAMDIPGAYEALAFTHTAYSGEYPPVTQDHATVLRAAGFREAGVPDPLIVRAWTEGLMELPDTPNYENHRPAAKRADR